MKTALLLIWLISTSVYADTTLCKSDDIVVFSCNIKKKKLSVCKHKNKIIYKYGVKNKVELQINSKPIYSYEQFVRANYEEHLRFHNKGYDYIVYSNEFMEYDKTPYDGTARYVSHNGVYVLKNNKLLTRLECKKTYPSMKGIHSLQHSVQKEKYTGYY